MNNCGTNIRKRAEDFESEEFAKVFDTNFMSCMWLSMAALPLLKSASEKRKAEGKSGAAVVNLSSVAGCTHIPSGFPYAASKAAMDQMTRNLAVEWSRFGIRVNSVAPGAIDTPLIRTANPQLVGTVLSCFFLFVIFHPENWGKMKPIGWFRYGIMNIYYILGKISNWFPIWGKMKPPI